MSTATWQDTGHPHELDSVMHYCSHCGGMNIMLLKNGEAFDSGPRLSTTDVLQVDIKYCNAVTHPSHATDTCAGGDQTDVVRDVFLDRVCNGINDCNDASDEDGTIRTCLGRFSS